MGNLAIFGYNSIEFFFKIEINCRNAYTNINCLIEFDNLNFETIFKSYYRGHFKDNPGITGQGVSQYSLCE